MTSNYNFVLNFNNSAPINTGYTFKTGDKGITFNFDVRELDPTGMTPKIAFHRANATSVESSSVTLSDGIYSYTILGNEFAVPGVVVADLKFYDSDTQRVSSASFIFGVISDTLDGLGGGTAGYSDELETLRAEMEEAEATLEAYVAAFGDLGPLNPRGDYDANEDYTTCDCVYYSGASWICKAPCAGETPGYPSDYWQKMADGADTSDLAHKVTGATAGNFAGLDANGDLTNSGIAFPYVKKGRYLDLVDLGTSYTAELKNDISTQKFNIAVVGGHLTLNSHKYYFAHPNIYLHTGDPDHVCETPHMYVVSEDIFLEGIMNSSATTAGGYLGSDFKTGNNGNTALSQIRTIIQNDFGAANILTHRDLFTNAVSNGAASSWAWADTDIDVLSECLAFGHNAQGKNPAYETGIDKCQLELFAKRPDLLTIRKYWWLRDVASASSFALVNRDGIASNNAAHGSSIGFRVGFAIC